MEWSCFWIFMTLLVLLNFEHLAQHCECDMCSTAHILQCRGRCHLYLGQVLPGPPDNGLLHTFFREKRWLDWLGHNVAVYWIYWTLTKSGLYSNWKPIICWQYVYLRNYDRWIPDGFRDLGILARSTFQHEDRCQLDREIISLVHTSLSIKSKCFLKIYEYFQVC